MGPQKIQRSGFLLMMRMLSSYLIGGENSKNSRSTLVRADK